MAGDLKLKQSIVHGEPALELVCSQPHRFHELRDLGLINEQINWKQRFFVPSDEAKGIPLFVELLGRYPALESDTTGEVPAILPFASHEVRIVTLEDWVLPSVEQVERPLESTELTRKCAVSPGEPCETPPLADDMPIPSLVGLTQDGTLLQRRRKTRSIVEEQGVLFSLN